MEKVEELQITGGDYHALEKQPLCPLSQILLHKKLTGNGLLQKVAFYRHAWGILIFLPRFIFWWSETLKILT